MARRRHQETHEYSEEVLKQFDVLTGMQREVLEFARGERHVVRAARLPAQILR